MAEFPPFQRLRPLIELARSEDLGPGDISSSLVTPEHTIGVATLRQKQAGVICGLPIVPMICRVYNENIRIEELPGQPISAVEGRWNGSGTSPLLRLTGQMRALLAAERVILNFLQHMSGVATLTRRFVEAVKGTSARIYDTRKTLPGLRLLDKYAVAVGGGHNHRMGLFDAVLIKNNHLTMFAGSDLSRHVAELVADAHRLRPDVCIEVEVTTLDELRCVLAVEGVNIVLLDNMDCRQLRRAVELRDRLKARVELEASGGVTLRNVASVARTGVDRIAVGCLTHSAPAIDISMSIEPLGGPGGRPMRGSVSVGLISGGSGRECENS